MQKFDFELSHMIEFGAGITLAFILATLIGAERQWRQRSAGLRTNVLVAVGAAIFISLGSRLNGQVGAAQLAAYVVSGIGFLGAGVIMKDGSRVWGLNTAATLWCSAAVGTLSGIGLAIEAIFATAVILAGNTLLRPLVNAINRAPVDEGSIEANYEVHVSTAPECVGAVRDALAELIEAADYPIREIEVTERSNEVTELTAVLVSTSIVPEELDIVIDKLESLPMIRHASWSSSTDE